MGLCRCTTEYTTAIYTAILLPVRRHCCYFLFACPSDAAHPPSGAVPSSSAAPPTPAANSTYASQALIAGYDRRHCADGLVDYHRLLATDRVAYRRSQHATTRTAVSADGLASARRHSGQSASVFSTKGAVRTDGGVMAGRNVSDLANGRSSF